MKQTDPIYEIRLVREAHAKEFNFDLDLIAHDIREREKKLHSEGWKLVSRRKSVTKI